MPAQDGISHVHADNRLSLGATVRARRRRLGLRQSELADLADVSARFVYALETDKATVQLDKVLNVLTVLGLHLELRRGTAASVTTDDALRPHGSP
ncbi:MAG: type II toxin-antitoxin system Y4mF family antitoxin [Geodermatophilaceae bacterium]|nr:type II toxin-antitoxin system Y4mF family antitoxin [Geodermatophilaceae bacterium]